MGILKMQLERKIWKKNELIEAVKETYNQISEDTIFNLVESFQRRMIKCIESNGERVFTNNQFYFLKFIVFFQFLWIKSKYFFAFPVDFKYNKS